MTETELKLIAKAANMGSSKRSFQTYKTPAAIGIPCEYCVGYNASVCPNLQKVT